MAAANTHVAYAWWRAYGDAFDVNAYEISSIAVPNRWLDDAETRREVRRLARSLIAAAQDPANTTRRVSGTRGARDRQRKLPRLRPRNRRAPG